jgi:fructose/tagatose bisphosphate aldolase
LRASLEENSGLRSRAKCESHNTNLNNCILSMKSSPRLETCFSIAAAFCYVHGVYKPGNVKLSP